MSAITGLILAGGRGQRMGGVDKGLQSLNGRPLVASVIDRLRPQVTGLLINANQNPDRYGAFGYPVIADQMTGQAGPLSGLQAGLLACETDLLASVPCDSPLLPHDLVARLHDTLLRQGADLAVATTAGRAQPVFLLLRCYLTTHLNEFLTAGGRKIDLWYSTLKVAEVAFDDCPQAFTNVNTLQELQTLSGQLLS